MAAGPGALIPPTANPALEHALRAALLRRHAWGDSFGRLEEIALRLGLIQNSTCPRVDSARLIVFAADHGLAIDEPPLTERSTAATVAALLDGTLPLAEFARSEGIELTVVDSGVAEPLAPNSRLLARKIAHGTRNARVGAAMSTDQAHAAMRAGMEIADLLAADAVACAGIGVASTNSAALVLSCLSGRPLGDFAYAVADPADPHRVERLQRLGEIKERHGHLDDPVEMVAAVGGFEVAMMCGLILASTGRRRLVVIDGIAACAALLVASEIAPAAPEYCVFARSSPGRAIDRAIGLFGARPLLEVDVQSIDGTGATLSWPVVRSSAALFSVGTTGSASVADAPATVFGSRESQT
jgi:nicotinate-nucleotide--dimethylbenzimidazole phosphoribosyltransferase